MQTTQTKYKLLFGCILLVLSASAIRKILYFFPPGVVSSRHIPVTKPELQLKIIFNRDFQEQAEIWINENIGFRNKLIKVRNQIAWTLFAKSYVKETVVGKEGYLFDLSYIYAYTGQDYGGRDSLDFKINRLKAIQDTLTSMGKTMLVMLAPGKGSYSNQYIPDKYLKKIGPTYYEDYKTLLPISGIKYLDFKAWFEQMRDTCTYPLFPKTGIHWSRFGATLAADSMLGMINLLQPVRLPRIKFKNLRWSYPPNPRDEDIGIALNLIKRPNPMPMGERELMFSDTLVKKLSVLIVADSYWFGISDCEILNNDFSAIDLLYYNKLFLKNSDRNARHGVNLSSTNRDSLVLSYDIILLLATDANLKAFPWQFDKIFSTASTIDNK